MAETEEQVSSFLNRVFNFISLGKSNNPAPPMAESDEQVSSFFNRICHFISLGKSNNTTLSNAEIAEKFAVLGNAFLKKVRDKQASLGILKKLILLLNYDWNEAALVSDWQKLMHVVLRCAEDIETHAEDNARCSTCQGLLPCLLINCGHYLCDVCFQGLINNQLERRNVNLVCPSPGCNMFINYSNIPENLGTDF